MSDCILWTKAKSGNGYGVTSVNGKQTYVHRLSAEKAFGHIPKGMVVAHKCDTPACYNPEHLFICTQAENLQDMKIKNRGNTGDRHGSKTKPERVAKGENVSSSKLTKDQVLEIRATYKPGCSGKSSETSLSAIAKKYNVGFQAIHKIVNRITWKHI